MNCRRVQKLIPLYVEGDLQLSLANRITSHLDLCGRCNWLADEYKESQSWLRSSAPPEYDDASLADFKRSVLARTQEVRWRPSVFATLLQQWNRRQVLALSAPILIVLAVLAFYIYRARIGPMPVLDEIAEQHSTEQKKQPDEERFTASAGEAPVAGPRKRRYQKRIRPHASIARRGPMVTTPTEDPGKVSDPNAATEQTTIESSGDSPDMLRIEIRTSDPNIRIIWFAPKAGDGPVRPVTDTN
jgi:Putative zinc-finger